MVYLLLTILLLGLFQSIFELFKDDTKRRRLVIRALASLYILGFILGIFVTIYNSNDAKITSSILKRISNDVELLNASSGENLSRLDKSIKQSGDLIDQSESLNKKMISIMEIKKSLLEQYEIVNDKLSKQIDLEQKQLNERAPNIALYDIDSKLEGSDTSSYSIGVCIRNSGKRSAQIQSGVGLVLCFNNRNKVTHVGHIKGSNNPGILEPNDLVQMKLCYYSDGFKNIKELRNESSFSVIFLKVKYTDIAIHKDSVQTFYTGWIPDGNEFGGLKDWQYNAAKVWIKTNTDLFN